MILQRLCLVLQTRGESIMPIITVKCVTSRAAAGLKAAIAQAASDLAANVLHKDPKVTAVVVEAVDPARHDAREVREIAVDVERNAVERDPALDADADGSDLVLTARTLVGPPHPDPDAILASLARDAKGCERSDEPFLQRSDEAP